MANTVDRNKQLRTRLGRVPSIWVSRAIMRSCGWLLPTALAATRLHFSRRVRRELFEPAYDIVYGSAIFKFSADRI
jgi:hypothetical protein